MRDPGSGTAVEVDSVRVMFGDRAALDGLTLRVASGTAFGLVGPNGSGKSTLIGCLAGLRMPDAGSIRVGGLAPGPEARRRTGFVFQDSGLDPLMTCRETLQLQARLFGVASSRAAADTTLERAGLADRADSLVSTLSGGMKRRLAIARAVLPAPELLVLDEPTTGLDPDSRRELWVLLGELRAAGATLLVASQDVLEIDRECDSVAFLRDGGAVLSGSVAELKKGLRRDSVTMDFAGAPNSLADAIREWPEVGSCSVEGTALHVNVDDAAAFVPRVFAVATLTVTGVRIRESTLEDAYSALVSTHADAA